MNTKTNQRLWIFGDSFANIRNGDSSWQILLKNKFVGNDVIVSARGGRDIQTVIDIFLRCLHLIKDDDLVIVMLPTLARVRYPIKNEILKIDLGEELNIDGLSDSIADGFTAYHAHSIYHKNIKKELMFPLDVMDDSMIEDLSENEKNREPYYGEFEIKNFLNKKNKLSYDEMGIFINTSNIMLHNYNKQFYSFLKTFKFKINFFSWSTDFEMFDDNVVTTIPKIEKNIGEFQTLHQLYIQTNGENGVYGDHHWSELGDKKFSEYIIKNNLKYFN